VTRGNVSVFVIHPKDGENGRKIGLGQPFSFREGWGVGNSVMRSRHPFRGTFDFVLIVVVLALAAFILFAIITAIRA
jgi:hypothetical protein